MRYTITEKNGTYTATIPLPMIDGRTLLIQGTASIGEVMDDFGLVAEVGVFQDYKGKIRDNPRFKALNPEQQKIAIAIQDSMFHKDYSVQRRIATQAEARYPWLDRVLHLRGGKPSGFLPSIGKFFKGIAKSKALRKALKVARSVLKNPITAAALGVVTGGAAIPALGAANAAIRIADAARLPGKKGKAARKVIRASLRAAEKQPPRPIPEANRAAVAQKLDLLRGRPTQPDPRSQLIVQRLQAIKARQPAAAARPRRERIRIMRPTMQPAAAALAKIPELIVRLQFVKG